MIESNELLFQDYQDPQDAVKVWEAYQKKLQETGLERKAQVVLAECRASVDLDARLDLLLTQGRSKHSTRTVPPANIDDIDADSLYSNARRDYEEHK